MKKFSKLNKKILFPILSIILIFWWYYFFFSGNNSEEISQEISFETAELWDLSETISVFWTAELVDEQSLRFNKVWKITKVNFKEWDSVKNWDIIANLEDTTAQNKITQARISVANSKLQLTQLYEEVDESKKISAQNAIEKTEQDIQIAEKELQNLITERDNSLQSAQDSISSKENDIEDLKKDNSTSLVNIQNSVKEDIFAIEKAVEWLDYVLWVTEKNKEKNDEFESNLWTLNTTYLTEAKDSLRKTINNLEILQENSWDDLEKFLELDLISMQDLEKASDLTYKVLENSSESSSFTSSDISSKKSEASSYKTLAQKAVTSINNYLNQIWTITTSWWEVSSLNLSLQKAELDLAQLKENYDLSVENYEVKLESKNNDLENLRTTLSVNEKSYEELIEWPTAENIQLKNNSIAQAEINLADAIKDLENYRLEAPFDWVIRKMDFKVWDNLASDTEKYVYIENPNLFEISVFLDQIDIVKVEFWTKTEIEFDAYPWEIFDWKINLIDTTPVQNSWVVSYEVKIIIDDESFDKRILSWMTANIEIINEERDWVVLVSASAITTSKEGKNIVRIASESWRPETREVEVWLSSNWKTEIISWISEWEKIITSTFSAAWKKDAASAWLWIFPTWERTWWWGWPRN